MPAPRPALFLDRDGVINVDHNYVYRVEDFEWIEGARETIARFNAMDWLVFVVTNQSGIGRGLYSLDDVLRCNDRMEELLGLPRPIFAGICIAPEGPDQPSRYRKPSPAYLLESIAHHGLDPAQCWMLGDRESDIRCGLEAQINSAAVCTGKHDAAGWAALALPGVPVFPDLSAFVATLP